MTHLSLIVSLHNHLAATQAMLASLRATLPDGLDWELLFIDDGSTDGTRAWLVGLRDPAIRILLNDDNLGYAQSNNRAVAQARGERLALLNNDLVLRPGWLPPMLAALDRPRVGLVGNVQYRLADGALDHAGVHLNPRAQFEHLREPPDPSHPEPTQLAVTGACVLLRRADFDRLGGFDPGYRNGGEDIDLCFGLRQRGRRILLASASQIDHHVSLSRGGSSLQQEANSRRLFAKWRRAIKNALTDLWLRRLNLGPSTDQTELAAPLDPRLRATPHLAARLIAEAAITRQEARWRHLFDGQPEPTPVPARPASGRFIACPVLADQPPE